jgi:hypothetical protein
MKLRSPGDVSSKFYLRLSLADKAGVFGEVASILGRHGISIMAASQRGGDKDAESVPVVVLTHEAKASALRRRWRKSRRVRFPAPIRSRCAFCDIDFLKEIFSL